MEHVCVCAEIRDQARGGSFHRVWTLTLWENDELLSSDSSYCSFFLTPQYCSGSFGLI